MDPKTLEALIKLSRDAAEPKVFKPDTEPNHVYFLREGGELTRFEAEPLPREHEAQDIATVVAFAKSSPTAVIWYNRTAVVCLIDDSTRRDSVTLALTPSPQLELLTSLAGKRRMMDQREMLRFLRYDLKACLSSAGNIVSVLSSIKWRAGSDTTSKVAAGQRSVGRVIEADVIGTEKLPEYLTLSVPIFANYNLRHVSCLIECLFEADVEAQKLELSPLPGELDKAFAWGEEYIHCQIVQALGEHLQKVVITPLAENDNQPAVTIGQTVPIYYGTP